MPKSRLSTALVLLAIGVFSAVLGGAAWWGKYRAEAVAKPPTGEMEALAREVSDLQTGDSFPQQRQRRPESDAAPNRGSGDSESGANASAVVQTLQRARQVGRTVPADQLRAELDAMDPASGGPQRVALEAALGYALLAEPQPAIPEAGRAFCNALDLTPDPNERVAMAVDFGAALLERRGDGEALEVTSGGRFIGAELTPPRFQIEAIRGIAYDALGLGMRAQETFREAFEAMLDTPMNDSDPGRDVARVLALRLARQYRDDGDEWKAEAVAIRLRTWLGEEELLSR